MTTSAIVASVSESESEIRSLWLDAAAALAAPALVVALPDRLSVWKVAPDATRHREIGNSPLYSHKKLTDRLGSLSPSAIQQWKRAGVQATLFPIATDLLTFSRKKAREELTERVEHALLTARELSPKLPHTLHPRLVIAAMAALMIRDKANQWRLTGGALIDAAQQRYPSYFSWMDDLQSSDREIVERLADDMGQSINFAGLEPSMVSDVYEQAMLDDAQRRRQGSYYTPPALAQSMLNSMPIESLPPNDRHILDPACGSGTLLLASVKRLQGLEPLTRDAYASHDYVVSHLHGFDSDPFAVEIAKLSLLMTALPIGNSWKIDAVDALAQTFENERSPSVIVSNPPWEYQRIGGRRQERANQFVEWMLKVLQPGGLLGCILPVSWLNSATSRNTRRLLLDTCDLLDVWQLPEETFASHGMSTAAPTVIIAQKRQSSSPRRRTTLVKRVAPGEGKLSTFLDTGLPTSAIIVDPGSGGEGLLQGPISSYFKRRDGFVNLGRIAAVRSGCAHMPNRPTRQPAEGTHLEVVSAGDLPPFGGVPDEKLVPVRYPEDFHRVGASDTFVRSQKVLVSAKRSAESPYRFKVGIDFLGIVPRETFYMIKPLENREWSGLDLSDQLYALMAALGSGLANAWVVEAEPKRNISSGVYRNFPLPTDQQSVARLARAGRQLYDAAESRLESRLHLAVLELEKTVEEVYELDAPMQRLITQTMANFPGPEGLIRYSLRESELKMASETSASPGSFGTVLGVAANSVQLWVSGVTDDDGEWVNLPSKAPGWILAEGNDFVVSGPLEDLSLASYFLHQSEWVEADRPSLEDLSLRAD